MQILIDAVQELIESHEAAEGGGGGGKGDRGEGERKEGGGGGAERGGDGGCVSQLSFADAAPQSQHLHSSGTNVTDTCARNKPKTGSINSGTDTGTVLHRTGTYTSLYIICAVFKDVF